MPRTYKLESWSQNKCVRCGKYLGIDGKKFCKECRTMKKYTNSQYKTKIRAIRVPDELWERFKVKYASGMAKRIRQLMSEDLTSLS